MKVPGTPIHKGFAKKGMACIHVWLVGQNQRDKDLRRLYARVHILKLKIAKDLFHKMPKEHGAVDNKGIAKVRLGRNVRPQVLEHSIHSLA